MLRALVVVLALAMDQGAHVESEIRDPPFAYDWRGLVQWRLEQLEDGPQRLVLYDLFDADPEFAPSPILQIDCNEAGKFAVAARVVGTVMPVTPGHVLQMRVGAVQLEGPATWTFGPSHNSTPIAIVTFTSGGYEQMGAARFIALVLRSQRSGEVENAAELEAPTFLREFVSRCAVI